MDGVATQTSRTLVGRDAELTEITSLLGVRRVSGEVGAGSAAVLLSGDAGVGKTRLLAELADLARAEGRRVLTGHCLDFGDSALPYLPFSEVLGRMAGDLPDLVDAVVTAHPALARLQPGRRMMRADEDDEPSRTDRAALFEAVHALLEAAARDGPLLLVVEDLHWADQSTRDLLSFLFTRPLGGAGRRRRVVPLRRPAPAPSPARPGGRVVPPARGRPDPPDAAVAPGTCACSSPSWPRPGGALAGAEVEDIVDRAEGNAFFVEELVGAASSPGRWVPDDLADVLLVRLDRVDDAARQVVRAASVAGRRVAHELLAAASGLDPRRWSTGCAKRWR